MKLSVDKILKDVQFLSKQMHSSETVAEDLVSKASLVKSKLEAMRQYPEESLTYAEISKRAGKHPLRKLILCLAAENKQLEQLKTQNQTLETSLFEHQSALEMIMTKYREQISALMRTNQVEHAVQLRDSTSQKSAKLKMVIAENSEFSEQRSLETHLSMMAAITQEVVEQSDRYSADLETELLRLRVENASLRKLLIADSESIKDDFQNTDSGIVSDNVVNLQPIVNNSSFALNKSNKIPRAHTNDLPIDGKSLDDETCNNDISFEANNILNSNTEHSGGSIF